MKGKLLIGWMLDSGATSHMTNAREILFDYKPKKGFIGTAGNERLPVEGIGKTYVSTRAGPMLLERVYYVPTINSNLISQPKLTHSGVETDWRRDAVTLRLLDGKEAKFPFGRAYNRLIINSEHPVLQQAFRTKYINAQRSPQAIHEALGHPGARNEKKMRKLLGEVDSKQIDSSKCEPCGMGKMTKARMPKRTKDERLLCPLARLHIDIFTQYLGNGVYRFALVAVDEATNYTHVVPLQNKAQAHRALLDFVALAERQTGQSLKAIRSDNDGVFSSQESMDWRATHGVIWETTVPYDGRGNGRAERANRTLRERMTAAMYGKAVPWSLWPEAIEYAALCLNLTPDEKGIVPFEAFWSKPAEPLIKWLRPFGCLCWAFVPERKRYGGKGGPRSLPAIFVGVHPDRKGWKLYSPHASPSTFWSNSVRFHEDKSWRDRNKFADWKQLIDNRKLLASRGEDVGDLTWGPLDQIATHDEEARRYYDPGSDDLEEEAYLVYDGESMRVVDDHELDDEFLALDEEIPWQEFSTPFAQALLAQAHAAINLKKGRSKKNVDPKLNPDVKEALSGENAPHWHEAIRRELEGIQDMGVLKIVDRPPGARLIDSRLLLKIKTDSDGLPRLYKARMVARGFSQIKGLEYDESFSPVAPYTAVRALLVIAAANGWHAHATDFTQAYLNGRLEHAVYMKPPAGAPLPPPGKVYQIVKGLYGLKQSGRVWHQHLDRLLRKIGSSHSHQLPASTRRAQATLR